LLNKNAWNRKMVTRRRECHEAHDFEFFLARGRGDFNFIADFLFSRAFPIGDVVE